MFSVNFQAPTLKNATAASSTSINVSWHEYDFEHWRGNFINFIVYWREVDEQSPQSTHDLTDYQSVTLSSGLTSFNDIPSTNPYHVISGLKFYTNYSVLLQVFNEVNVTEEHSQILYCRTAEDGNIYIHVRLN
jgi:Fibronectin type III domain.